MATLATTALTLLDHAKRLDENGAIADIAEVLTQQNEILADMQFIEGNLATGHKTTIRSGLPNATWRQLNYGVQPSKSTTMQVTDSIGMLENYSQVDKSLADLNGNTAAFRMSEDVAFIEGMNQDFSSTLFYGDTKVNPERFTGLSARYSKKAGEPAMTSADNIILGGGAANTNTSIWLIVWGPSTIHGIYPKGSKAGIYSEDKGQQTIIDANGGMYEGYRTHYKWDSGIVLRDWRYVVRIANVDVNLLTKDAATGAALIDLMAQACEQVQDLTKGKPCFYVNRTIRSFLRRQMMNKSNALLSLEDIAGKHVLTFDGIPVRRCDKLLSTEATVL
jgi:hypothetical protein